MKHLVIFTLSVILFASCDDNSPVKPTQPQEIIPVAVNYISSEDVVAEQTLNHTVVILLEKAAEAEGTLEVTLSGDIEAGYFTTQPTVSGGKIVLNVSEGDTEVSFDVIPVNNTKLNGNKTISFLLANASGSVALGESIEYLLTLVDDELLNKPQSWIKNNSAFAYTKNDFEYNEDGLISKLHWESKGIFGITSGTDEYSYNEAGGIVLISRPAAALETKFTWENGVIVKLERLQSGIVSLYNIYEYDNAGRVERVNNFTKNPAGEFASDSYTLYTYHEDGNVHTIEIYSYSPADDEYVMSVTTTYEEYIEGHNPVQLEVLPNQSIQTMLPTYYSKETQSAFQEYNVSYEFAENGNLITRSVTGAFADSGVTTYTYFE